MSDEPDLAEIGAQQQRHLRRILLVFFIVVVLLPIAGVGGWLAVLLIPMLLAGALGLREAIALRRSVQRHGDARGR